MSRNVRGSIFEILPRNTSMLRLAARARGTITTSRDDDIVHVTALFSDSGSTSRSPLPDSHVNDFKFVYLASFSVFHSPSQVGDSLGCNFAGLWILRIRQR